jgi:hypothetical protein
MMRTRGLVPFVIGGSLIALAAIARPARAEGPPASTRVTRPRAGAHLVPYVGVSSFQGNTGKGLDAGFRAGALGGGHINPMFSVNGEITMDILNSNDKAIATFTGIDLDLALSPLVHVRVDSVELVFGPKLGAFFGRINTEMPVGAMVLTAKETERGWLAGVNAGAFFSLSRSFGLGALLSFVVRNPTTACTESTLTPGNEVCTGSNLTADKVLALTIAMLL